MKNKCKLIGIIPFVAVIGLLLAGCNFKGGTVTIQNKLDADIYASAFSGTTTPTDTDLTNVTKTIKPNQEAKWTFDEDGDVTYHWLGTGSALGKSGGDAIKLSGGEDRVFEAK